MITEQDLQEAIAECLGQRNPNASTCLKLAAFYIIRRELYPEDTNNIENIINKDSFLPIEYRSESSYQSSPKYFSETEFGKTIENKNEVDILGIFDELMTALQVLQPRLYNNVLDKLNNL